MRKRIFMAVCLPGLLAATLATGSLHCGSLSPAVSDGILKTTSAVAGIIQAWCNPAISPSINRQACEQARLWAEIGEAGVALILPNFTAPEPPTTSHASFMALRPFSRAIYVGCGEMTAICAERPDDHGICDMAMDGCLNRAPTAVEISP